ncbi:MAG: alpha-L-rhamnosidase [Opitutales bacterium]|nr:alpha-L-rhamnosidase [Opitutales bacterium]
MKKFIFVLLGMSLFLNSFAVKDAMPSKEVLNTPNFYEGKFISPASDKTDPQVCNFRNTFELKQVPESLVINITAENRYILYVNGKYVCRGSESGDFCNWFYDSVDIAPYLKQGKNVVAVSVVYFSDSSPAAFFWGNGCSLWVQPNSQEYAFLNSNSKNWKYQVDKSVVFPTRVLYAGGSEFVNVKNAMSQNWKDVDFNDSSWNKAFESLRVRNPNWFGYARYVLKPRSIPMLEEKPIRLASVRKIEGIKGVSAKDVDFINGKPFEIPANTNCKIVLDMGHLTNAYVDFSVEGGANANMKAIYCESFTSPKLGGNKFGKGNRNEIEGKIPAYPLSDFYVFDGKSRSIQTYNFRCFRYVQLEVKTAEQPLKIKDFKGTFTGYPFIEKAKFESDDSRLKKIWEVGWRTARLCAWDTYFDCPFHERLQYIGDTRIQALISLYVAGDARLMKKALKMYNSSRMGDGIVQSRYPCKQTQFIAPFCLYWIGMLKDYYMHVDDADFVAENLDCIESIINWYVGKLDKNTGMLSQNVPYWNFVDWVQDWRIGVPPISDKSGSAIISLHLAIALDDASKMMNDFGRKDVAERYQRLSKSIKDSVYKLCWNEKRGLLSDAAGIDRFSQHANIFGILSNAIPERDQKNVLEKIIKEAKTSYAKHNPDDIMEATFYFKFYLFRAMNKVGISGDIFWEQLEPWHDMVNIGLTTFAENPEPTRSDCHAWSASPIYEFFATVCGVNPASPSFKTVRISPNMGKLNYVKASIPHPKGTIKIELRKNENSTNFEYVNISLPDSVEGELVLSENNVKKFTKELIVNTTESKRSRIKPLHLK